MNTNKYSNKKIAWFPEKLQSMRDGITTAPIYVRIKPTNRCNHNCYFCVYNPEYSKMHNDINHIDEISKEDMQNILTDLHQIGVKAVTYSGGGEPLVHKNICDILRQTLDYNIDLSMLTNGELLKDERADLLSNAKWVRISMDYYNAELFASTRGGNEKRYLKIIDNIKKFAKNVDSKECELGVNYIITKDNFSGLIEAAKVLTDIGINNIRFSPVWTTDFHEYHSEIKNIVREQLDDIKATYNNKSKVVYDSYNIDNQNCFCSYKQCYSMQVIPVIGADKKVYNCHNKAYDMTGLIGSIENNSFSDLWFSKETANHFKQFRPDLDCKHQCANNAKNEFIHELMDCYGDNYV